MRKERADATSCWNPEGRCEDGKGLAWLRGREGGCREGPNTPQHLCSPV